MDIPLSTPSVPLRHFRLNPDSNPYARQSVPLDNPFSELVPVLAESAFAIPSVCLLLSRDNPNHLHSKSN